MKIGFCRNVLRVTIAAVAALALAVLMLSVLQLAAHTARSDGSVADVGPGADTDPDEADLASVASEPPLPNRVLELMGAGEGQINNDGLDILTTVETDSGDDAFAFNGGLVTYTIMITNTGNQRIDGILVRDDLPEETLSGVACGGGDDCKLFYKTVTVQDPFGGGQVSVTVTDYVTWVVDSLVSGTSTVMTVRGQVGCQAEGTPIKNRAFFSYREGSIFNSGNSNETRTTVRTPIDKDGKVNLSAGPTWCSSDLGGTWDTDWGDFDGDGDLDLAVGSVAGVVVYRNEGGQVNQFWRNERYTYGVSWVDADRDGMLELAAVGSGVFTYSLEGDGFVGQQVSPSFAQAVAVADYNADGHLDLAVGGYNNVVTLYPNNGAGSFPVGQDIPIAPSYVYILAWGDYDNDGDQDLAVGGSGGIEVLKNDGAFSSAYSDTSAASVYGLAWGDYDNDGWLDLAASDYLNYQVLIYKNTPGGFAPQPPILTSVPPNCCTPLGIDWGDFDGDGQLELAVSEVPPKMYRYDRPSDDFSAVITLTEGVVGGISLFGDYFYAVPSVNGVDIDNDGDLDLALGNLYGRSLLFTTFAPHLKPTLSDIDSSPYVSVAWGDADHDGNLDLLFGAGSSAGSAVFGSGLYYNEDGEFAIIARDLIGGFGPSSVAFGDVDGDGRMDIALGTSGRNEVYLSGNTGSPDWTSADRLPSNSLAWGDADDDGDLDLLVGNGGANPNVLYLNQGTQLDTVPGWTSDQTDDTMAVAWGDYNRDRYLDFAVANAGQSNRVYCNNGDNTFSLVWSSPYSMSTRSVAWGDYDGDGDLDLATGNYGGPNFIYDNPTCPNPGCSRLPVQDGSCQTAPALSARPVWTMTTNSGTTIYSSTSSLAWGDWDNDGDLDLAVGNEGEPDQVYANRDSKPGRPQLAWIWASSESFQTTGVAWGDKDGDGDLDLVISQNGEDSNGVYENTYVTPSHLTGEFAKTMPLPNNPTYLTVARPGDADAAYFYSSADLLSGPVNPTVTVRFQLFDPDGTRNEASTNPADEYGDAIIPSSTRFEFSLDGGGNWFSATGQLVYGPGGDSGLEDTRRLGQAYTYLWNAVKDKAISDDARFRIRIVNHLGGLFSSLPIKRAGLIQRASVSAISPPFRVRGLSCQWPDAASIEFNPGQPNVGENVRMEGAVVAGSGLLTFTWDFGDGATGVGQVVQHKYDEDGIYLVTLMVRGEPCPITESSIVTSTIKIGFVPDRFVYLPLIFKSSSGGTALSTWLERPAQVTGLSGSSQPDADVTHLIWKPNGADEAITGYRVYRRSRAEGSLFQLLATVPASLTTYTDESACGYAYYVTAYNPAGESSPSTASYYSLPCRE